ncbi:hypothetical protein EWM64_g4761 [Hericium alpestre]|uniref:Uncharacterized protein n=1 Tax=Hericium alpestre TaxID=135208 RepID=A0A4Y9ZYH5_9AGAM|nr:hypothetical protein EWM64_g4761 [Hericium alpestre]
MGNKRNSGPYIAPRRAGLRSAQQDPQRIKQKRASVDECDGHEETLLSHAKRTRLSTYDEGDPEELQIIGEGEPSFSNNDADLTRVEQLETGYVGQVSGGGLIDLMSNCGVDVDDSRMKEYIEYYAAEERRWSRASFEEWRAGAKEVVDNFTAVMQMYTAQAVKHALAKKEAYITMHNELHVHRALLYARGEKMKGFRSKEHIKKHVLEAVELMLESESKDVKAVGEA